MKLQILCLAVIFTAGWNALAGAPQHVQQAEAKMIFMHAQQALAAGHYDAARMGFQQVLRIDPQSAAAYSNLGVVEMRTHHLDAAIRSLIAAKKLAPQVVGIDLNLGLAYYQEYKFNDAIPYLQRVLAALPALAQAHFLLGMCYFMLDEYQPAIQALEPIRAREQSDLDYLFVLGISYGKVKRTDQSKETFAQLVRAGGDTPYLHFLLGKAYLGLYQNQKAIDELQKAAAADPGMPFAHYDLGVAYKRLGRLGLASKEFSREMTISPREPWSYQSQGEVDYDMGHFTRAIQMYRQALGLDAKLPDSLAGLGRAYIHSGKIAEGIQYLKRASELKPESADIRYQLGRAYLKSGDRTEAQQQFAVAQKLQADLREREAVRFQSGPPTLEDSSPGPMGAQNPEGSPTPPLHTLPLSAPPGGRYAGSQACARCHSSEAATQALTPMAHALEPPADCALLREHPLMTFRNGPYLYKIQRQGTSSMFTVSDGRHAISVPILWAFGYGIGGVGQTYVFRYDGRYFESQVSYYEGIQRLDITMGHILYPPASLGAALGYPIPDAAGRKCFACHATGAVSGNHLQLDKMIPGVSCEACHGPGAGHIGAVQSGNLGDLHIFNPRRLSTGEITAFCGSCHRTAAQERLLRVRGVENVRFQGYRLERSRCYNPNDQRISCTACHDPHRAVVTSTAYYDAKCLACHARSGASTLGGAPVCPVATRDCVTCHMPKVEVPGVYHKFTDHFIRVVKANEPYPS